MSKVNSKSDSSSDSDDKIKSKGKSKDSKNDNKKKDKKKDNSDSSSSSNSNVKVHKKKHSGAFGSKKNKNDSSSGSEDDDDFKKNKKGGDKKKKEKIIKDDDANINDKDFPYGQLAVIHDTDNNDYIFCGNTFDVKEKIKKIAGGKARFLKNMKNRVNGANLGAVWSISDRNTSDKAVAELCKNNGGFGKVFELSGEGQTTKTENSGNPYTGFNLTFSVAVYMAPMVKIGSKLKDNKDNVYNVINAYTTKNLQNANIFNDRLIVEPTENNNKKIDVYFVGGSFCFIKDSDFVELTMWTDEMAKAKEKEPDADGGVDDKKIEQKKEKKDKKKEASSSDSE